MADDVIMTPMNVLSEMHHGATIDITQGGYFIKLGKVTHRLKNEVIDTMISARTISQEKAQDGKINYVLSPNSIISIINTK